MSTELGRDILGTAQIRQPGVWRRGEITPVAGKRWPARFAAFMIGLLTVGFVAGRPPDTWALAPEEVLVIANAEAEQSVHLARYYMQRRQVPDGNLLLLRVTEDEVCTRGEYEERIAAPVRSRVRKLAGTRPIRCLLVMYGVPLKIAMSPELSPESEETRALKRRREQLDRRLSELEALEGDAYEQLSAALEGVEEALRQAGRIARDNEASVDSELALVLNGGYSTSGWVSNPYFLGNQLIDPIVDKRDVLMVSRLDGPDGKVVKRMIEDAIHAEVGGLSGRAYFDARWPKPEKKTSGGYEFYDRSIHEAAALVEKSGVMPVTVDADERLFQAGECTNAALYCGWYSLATYVDAFTWSRGAVGYHIASGECKTLKRRDSLVWCKMMLQDGAAATVGPVSEPYVTAFPVPAIFFGFLVDGYLTLAECYLISLPYLSWKMVLVSDPLYRPFGKE